MDLRRVVLIAHPTPCSLVLPGGFPCQKKEKSLSLTDHDLTSLASWRATMSIRSLLSFMSMAAVLRESLLSRRSSEKPGVIALTFHVPIFRRVFSSGYSWCMVRVVEPLPGFNPKPHAPIEVSGPWRGSTSLAAGCPACGGR